MALSGMPDLYRDLRAASSDHALAKCVLFRYGLDTSQFSYNPEGREAGASAQLPHGAESHRTQRRCTVM